jgi:hypothetical protein
MSTPHCLATLYAERARIAYQIEQGCVVQEPEQEEDPELLLLAAYDGLKADIALYERMWPARWVRAPEG